MTQSDLLPLLDSLSQEDVQTYGESLNQYIEQCLSQLYPSSVWTEEDNSIFNQGLIFISAYKPARQFCMVAEFMSSYNQKASRLIDLLKQVKGVLQSKGISIAPIMSVSELDARNRNRKTEAAPTSDIPERTGSTRVLGAMSLKSKLALATNIASLERPGRGRPPKVESPVIPAAGVSEIELAAPDGTDPMRPSIMDRRPQHLADYIDTLPEELQAEAANVGDMYMEMADLSYQLDTLCRNPKSFKGDRAMIAAKLCHAEERIRLLWRKIDAAHAESKGQIVSQELKDKLALDTIKLEGALRERTPGEYSKFEIDQMPEGKEKETAKAQRIDRDKKHLRRSDRKIEPENAAKFRLTLEEAAQELHDWGFLITDKQTENCLRYGYQVPLDWQEPSNEEKLRLRKEQRNARDRENRRLAREAKAEAKAAAEAEALAPYKQEGIRI